MDPHDEALARAFDRQAPLFESSPLQTDAKTLARLVAFAALPAGAEVLDAGCGPGIVAEAFLAAGYRVSGVDLSAEIFLSAQARRVRPGADGRITIRAVRALVRGVVAA